MKKTQMVGVRLTEEELERLDEHCQGQLSRAQVIRCLVLDFLEKPDEEQRAFLVQKLFEK